MKKLMQTLLLAGAIAMTMTGCLKLNSENDHGNYLGKGPKTLPYKSNEKATHKVEHSFVYDEKGRVTKDTLLEEGSGLNVNKDIVHHEIDGATEVAVAQATHAKPEKKSSGSGILAWLFSPTPVVVANGGYYGNTGYYTSGGGYYGNSYYSGGYDNGPGGRNTTYNSAVGSGTYDNGPGGHNR